MVLKISDDKKNLYNDIVNQSVLDVKNLDQKIEEEAQPFQSCYFAVFDG
jgi:hypothetical protein